MDVALIFSGLNVVVLLGLIYLYARIAIHNRAALSVGLVVFALILLAQNALTLFAYYAMEPLFGAETLPILSTAATLQFVAYAILLKLTMRP
jgi:hypothetical protein